MAEVVSEHLDDPSPVILVAELSSFQLRFAPSLAVDVGVVNNVAPDHLDWHGDWDAYRDAKAGLFRTAGPDTTAIAGDDDEARAMVRSSSAGVRWQTSASAAVDAGVGVVDGWLVATDPAGPLVPLTDLPAQAPHVVANAAAAAAAALAFGATPAAVAAALRRWELGAHRLEVVATAGGITWIDDSKATNVHAAIAALASADSIVWIAGGQAKGTDLSVLGQHLRNVRHAVLLGESADVLAKACAASNVPVSRAGTMQQAVQAAAAEARPGDTVLLSPAGASFDLFDGYADRGDQFAAAVREVTADRSTP
jgi:UDP-N-acetylmuramoylalanine--D-glutamate ligase